MSSDPIPPSEIGPGEIRFHQAAPPALPPGDYELTMTQTIQGASQPYETNAPFRVTGPRFYLKPEDIYSVYPPPTFGAFDNALPHVVFTRRTLPWERTLKGDFDEQDPNNPVPWMALLLLTADDFEDSALVDIKSRTVGELLSPGGNVQGPEDLDPGETSSDLCNTIDLPLELFAQIVPTREDLPFLAHVREVNTGAKETLSLKQDGWFTVVLGNRLPQTSVTEGIVNLACLVSLEGFSKLLPTVDAEGFASAALKDKEYARMAVLASWKFTCYGKNDFKLRMKELKDETLLQLPVEGLTGSDAGTLYVERAFSLGYAALNHTTRVGEKTVSFYRGPLVPLEMAPLDYATIPVADHALRYDPHNGLFAAEYAAAFELGRMMALNNRDFASAMQRFRIRVADDIAAEARQSALDRQFGAGDTLSQNIAQLFGKLGDQND